MKSLLLDTNVLLLFLVGTTAPGKVGGKRLEAFDLDDLRRVQQFYKKSTYHITLPNILTETSNLIGSGKQELVANGAMLLATFCSVVDEVYVPSKSVVLLPQYEKLGLTDAAILKLSERKIKILTVDHELAGRIVRAGGDAINLMHLKTPRRRVK